MAVPGLRRELGLADATMVTVGSIIGSGIFFVPNRVAAEFPDPGLVLILWAAGGLASLAGALSVAELAARRPRTGGPYVFVREAFGPTAGFVAGWGYFVLGKAAIGAAVLLVFAEHAAFFAGLSPFGKQLLAVWAAASLTFVNALGVKQGARVQNLFTVLKVGALLAVVGAALLLAPAPSPRPAPAAGGNLSVAFLLILFAYNAWINATFLGEEVRDPQRTLPRALAFGTLGAAGVYLAANLAFLHALGTGGVAGAQLVAAETMQRAVAFGGAFIAASVLVSTYGNANGGVLTGARIPYVMAQRGELPAALATLNARGVPAVALLAQFGLTALFILTGTFQAAATLGTLTIWMILLLVGASVFVLRRREGVPEGFRVPLYPWVPAAFLGSAVFVVALAAAQQPAQLLLALAVLAAGLPVLAAQRRVSQRRDAHPGGPRDGQVPVGELLPRAR